MLYHVTLTHPIESCPLFHPELRDRVREAGPRLQQAAADLGVTVHFDVTAAPAHRSFLLIETDDYTALQRYLALLPLQYEFDIVPVVPQSGATKTLFP